MKQEIEENKSEKRLLKSTNSRARYGLRKDLFGELKALFLGKRAIAIVPQNKVIKKKEGALQCADILGDTRKSDYDMKVLYHCAKCVLKPR